MWIDTHDGDLLNLDHVSRLFVGSDRTDRQVCVYARLDEKKEMGCAHVDIILGIFPVNATQSTQAATDQARQQLDHIRQQIRAQQRHLERGL